MARRLSKTMLFPKIYPFPFSATLFILLHLIGPLLLGNVEGESLDRVIVRPRVIQHQQRFKRAQTNDIPNEHSMSVELIGANLTLELEVNREIIHPNFNVRHQRDDGMLETWQQDSIDTRCHYRGSVKDSPGSWAVVSACSRMRGAFFDGKVLRQIEPLRHDGTSLDADHVTSPFATETSFICGVEGNHSASSTEPIKTKREARHQLGFEGHSYLELVLVIDHSMYLKFDRSIPLITQHALSITNFLHKFYRPLDISVTLVGLIVWSEMDMIRVTKDTPKLLREFRDYRVNYLAKEKLDVVQLLSGVKTDYYGAPVGRAYVDSVCKGDDNVGVVLNFDSPYVTARIMAHEIGHNFGLNHDNDFCGCADCIMAPAANLINPAQRWSTCSREKIRDTKTRYHCLKNVPAKCGNMVVDEGEECDCGLPAFCKSTCCDPNTCKFKTTGAECFSGECCDFQTCRFQSLGTPCRLSRDDCDLAEYCNGTASVCPKNLFKFDGVSCGDHKVCSNGTCQIQRLKSAMTPICPHNCSGRGVCNNLGKCHCSPGYSPPFCDRPGFGGSEDGGIAFSSNRFFLQGFGYYLTFLACVPIVIFLLFLWFNGKSDEDKAYLKANITRYTGSAKNRIEGCLRGFPSAFGKPTSIGCSRVRNLFHQIPLSKEKSNIGTWAKKKINLRLPNLSSTAGARTLHSQGSTPVSPYSTATTITPVESPASPGNVATPAKQNHHPKFQNISVNHLGIPDIQVVRPVRPAPPPPSPPIMSKPTNSNNTSCVQRDLKESY